MVNEAAFNIGSLMPDREMIIGIETPASSPAVRLRVSHWAAHGAPDPTRKQVSSRVESIGDYLAKAKTDIMDLYYDQSGENLLRMCSVQLTTETGDVCSVEMAERSASARMIQLANLQNAGRSDLEFPSSEFLGIARVSIDRRISKDDDWRWGNRQKA